MTRKTSFLTFICIAVRLAFGVKALWLYLGISFRLCRSHPTYTSEGRSESNARTQSTNFKPPAQCRPVPNSPSRTPVTGVGWANASRANPNPNSSCYSASAISGLNSRQTHDLTDSQSYPTKPYGTDQLKLMGRRRTKKIPPPLHPESLPTLPLALLPPPAEDTLASPNSVSSGHTSSTYVSANETQSQTGQARYSYHHQPASPTSTSELRYSYRYRPASPTSSALTKLPVTPYTPLFVQQRACQSPAVDVVRARLII